MSACDSMTPRRQAVFQFVSNYIAEHGMSPTLDEIGHELGIGRVAAHEHVKSLVRMGLVAMRPHEARSIRIVKDRCPTCGQITKASAT